MPIIFRGAGGVDVSGVTAAAGDVRAGKKFVDAEGDTVTGTLPDVVRATPSIAVSNAGLITASATQGAGYVAAGTKSATMQLTAQAGKTVTPGTSQQTAVEAGRYTTGPVYVAGDENLVSWKIVKDATIFGVTGTVAIYNMVGYSEPIDSDVNCSIDFANYAITISPNAVLDVYGDSSRITGVDNLALTITVRDNANKVYHSLVLSHSSANIYYPHCCDFMYCCWLDKTTPDIDDTTIEMIKAGTLFSAWEFDETSRVATIDGNASGASKDFRAALDYIAENRGDETPYVAGTITWRVV